MYRLGDMCMFLVAVLYRQLVCGGKLTWPRVIFR